MQNSPGSMGFVARMAAITSLTALGIDTMLPALPDIGASLSVENLNDVQLVITLFIFGMFFGELFFGPLSDSIGRKKALAIGIGIYCCGAIIGMMAPTMEILLFGRIVQGIGAAGPKIISRAMIRDQFSGKRMARVFSFIMTVFICIPMIAPFVGQYIASWYGWRMIFLVFLLIAGSSLAWISIAQPETLPLQERTKMNMSKLAKVSMRIFRHRTASCYALSAGLIFGVFLLYLSTSQGMFERIYGKGDSFPLYFAILATGFGSAALMNSRLVMKYGMRRLCFSALGVLVFLSLFFLVTGEQGVPSFPLFMVGCYCLLFCVGLLFSNLSALAMQPLGAVAGLGASLVSAASSIIAVLISVTAGWYFNDTLYVLIATIIICSFLSLLLFYLAESKVVSPVEGYDVEG